MDSRLCLEWCDCQITSDDVSVGKGTLASFQIANRRMGLSVLKADKRVDKVSRVAGGSSFTVTSCPSGRRSTASFQGDHELAFLSLMRVGEGGASQACALLFFGGSFGSLVELPFGNGVGWCFRFLTPEKMASQESGKNEEGNKGNQLRLHGGMHRLLRA